VLCLRIALWSDFCFLRRRAKLVGVPDPLHGITYGPICPSGLYVFWSSILPAFSDTDITLLGRTPYSWSYCSGNTQAISVYWVYPGWGSRQVTRCLADTEAIADTKPMPRRLKYLVSYKQTLQQQQKVLIPVLCGTVLYLVMGRSNSIWSCAYICDDLYQSWTTQSLLLGPKYMCTKFDANRVW
jgi:hypothetical protein